MKILAGHDGSAPADRALIYAAELAAKLGGELHLVTVVPDPCLSAEEVSANECSLITSSLQTVAQDGLKKAQGLITGQGLQVQPHFRPAARRRHPGCGRGDQCGHDRGGQPGPPRGQALALGQRLQQGGGIRQVQGAHRQVRG